MNANTEFKSTGIRVFGPKEKNLCLKAYQLLSEKYTLPPVKMHLHKIIPIGAGLGGGSADAANTLVNLNKLFKLNISEEEMENFASELGSDCAFFIRNKAMYATEKGNVLEPITLKLKNLFIVIVKPRVHISTVEAYAGISPQKKKISLKELVRFPIEEWKNQIENDFEKAEGHLDGLEIIALIAELFLLPILLMMILGSGKKDETPANSNNKR